ncbi:hypothetical protein TSUD_56780 [Trifolium subterraneum]|uniref:mRNA decay factor PAT1 domain-containing protein n=1 Tax=Trifolium subterraneum TaxID=3900 RepID=A0A2Z6NSE2_TRISU|nr:hypothetical protein TSUD_56780 [Trifolium subterraneum]
MVDMDGFGGGDDVRGISNKLDQFGDIPKEGEVFDATQYAFFGQDACVEEVELGGLDDDDCLPESNEEEFLLNREEVEDVKSLSDIDDLSTDFWKLNKVETGLQSTEIISERGSRENSTAEWTRRNDDLHWFDQNPYDSEGSLDGRRPQPYSSLAPLQESNSLYRTSSYPDQPRQQQQQQPYLQHGSSESIPNWFDQPFRDSGTQDAKRWSSQPHSSIAQVEESKSLYFTSLYPEKPQELLHFSNDSILAPNSSFTSFPPPGGRSQQASPSHDTGPINIPYHAVGAQMALSSQNRSHLSNSALQLGGLNHGSPVGGNMRQFPMGSPLNQRIPNQLVNQAGPYNNGVHPNISSGLPMINKYDQMLGMMELRDQMPKSAQMGRQNLRFSPQGFDMSNQKFNNGWPRFRSKYMSTEELDNIFRLQLAATHTNDPYVDDYYNQGCRAKKASSAKLRRHFSPAQIREIPLRASSNEPHAFLQVDALGRVPFSSIRRPRPLLEVDPPNSSRAGDPEQKILEKPLEQEPMLVARVTIEDGLCVLLDVDDIDRFLQFNQQLQDGGDHLKRKRQGLLEGLSATLQLVDPLGRNGDTVELAAKDDLVFLRIVSLPKGRKLLARYLQLLFPGGDLMRIVCMAICRHLRFLFGGLPSDPTASETVINLAKVVSKCIREMDLVSLSVCLASVVCSSELPPLRPLGSPAGDGTSLILVSVLQRATQLLTDPHTASNYTIRNRSLWQASFDEFFGLLIKYCVSKYDSISMAVIGPDVARAISRELPVELLHASIPHTDDRQRKILFDFAQRSVVGANSNSSGNGHQVNSQSVMR